MDLTIFTGDSKSLLVTVTDGNSNPVDLTGAQSIVWALIQNDEIILKKTLSTGISITSATTGQCIVAISASDTIALTPGTYSHECRVVTSSGQSGIVFTGTLSVNKAHV